MKLVKAVVMMTLIATVGGAHAAANSKSELPCQNQTKGQFNKVKKDASATADAVLNKTNKTNTKEGSKASS